jgi:glutamate carboxypeptidase
MRGISGNVALITTTDEETGSATTKDFIKEISAKAKAVLVLEASLNGKVKTARKGTSMYQIKIHGKASHAGLEPEKGVNATTEIAHAVLAISAMENPEHGTTVVPTTLHSGNTNNTVPDLAVLDIDVRSYSMADLQRVDSAIKGLNSVNPAARYEITGGFNRPPLESSSTMALYERAEKVAKELGMPPLGHASVGGASDGNIAAAAGAQVLDGLGAVGDGAHAAHEWVDISTLEDRSKLLHMLIKDLLNE